MAKLLQVDRCSMCCHNFYSHDAAAHVCLLKGWDANIEDEMAAPPEWCPLPEAPE